MKRDVGFKMNKIALAGCAIIENNALLLLYRTKRGWYELPGGKIDITESPSSAAQREIQEELCCTITILDSWGKKDFEEDGYTMTYHWFLARINPGEVPKVGEPEKFDHFKFINLNSLERYPLSPNMKNFVRELKSKLP